MSDVAIKEEVSLDSAYKTALSLLEDSYKRQKIFSKLPSSNDPLSWFEPLCIPALKPKNRKETIRKYLHEGKIHSIATTGMLAWSVINVLNDFNDDEKHSLEVYFTKCEEYFDCKTNAEGLMPTGKEGNWMASTAREGILIENQAYYVKILDILFLLTNDDLYDFKKKRLIKAVRERLDGAYVLDRDGSMDVRPNNFIAAFLAQDLFNRSDWEKTFDASLRDSELWLKWGGLSVLGSGDAVESWFFVNNIAGIVLHRLRGLKYDDKVQAILKASAKNVFWQEHSGRPCEVTINSDNKIEVQGLYGISLATFIYFYRTVQKS